VEYFDRLNERVHARVTLGQAAEPMVLCLLVYRLAEYRIRQRLEETNTVVLDQRKQTHQTPDVALAVSVFRGHQSGPDAA
jgi:transposase